MGYVINLLNGKLVINKEILVFAKASGDSNTVDAHIKIISELQYVIGILEHNETYQKY